MFGYISIALGGLVLLWLSKTLTSLQRNIALAKASGLPYAVAPVDGIPGFFWTAIHPLILGPLRVLPYSRDWLWPILADTHRGWHYTEELRDIFGEAFLIVSPGQIYFNCSNAEANCHITARVRDFEKPVELYSIVDIFGSNVLTTDGEDWKRHRKIVAPAFSEKSNALVWKESMRQTAGMLNFWSKSEGSAVSEIKVKNTAPEVSLLTLHVISAVGFGVRQLWDGESEEQLGTATVPGFNTAKLKENHNLTFKDSLNTLVNGIIWMAIFPVWLLNLSPLEINKKLINAHRECGDYFKELSEHKVKQLERGERAEQGIMDLMGPLVRASEVNPDDSEGLYLTKTEVIGNSWIFILAGHETSGNTTHFALLFLATAPEAQAHMQSDIDSIVGSRPLEDWTYEADMGLLYHSMVGATLNETLRLMPPIVDIPKIVRSNTQLVTFDGKTVSIPPGTFLHINTVGSHRNPRYWPHSHSKISSKSHDLDDFVPSRWLLSNKTAPAPAEAKNPSLNSKTAIPDGFETTSYDTDHYSNFFTPIKGSYVPFGDGKRSCPGRRFAQVEITAVLTFIFKTHSIELDVSTWASDDEVEAMGNEERRALYEKAMTRARAALAGSESIVALRMVGDPVPVRFVKRGRERFRVCYGL